MKNFTLRFLLVCVMMGAGLIAKATHSWGTEITYKCLDANGNYKVTLVYYRDCSGAPTCSGSCNTISGCTKTIQVRGADPSCNGTTFTTFNVGGVSVRDISTNPACPGSKSNCTALGCETAGSLTPGVERYEFEGTVNLGASSGIPTTCCKVVLSFEECCRPSELQNMIPQNHYSQTMINRCNMTFPNCNAPVIQQEIQPVLCANQGYIISFAAFDPDFDSLAYKLAPSLIGYDVDISYISPYTYLAPMPYLPPYNGVYPNGIKLDARTGELFVTPASYPFLGALTVLIEKWRIIQGTMQMIGTTQRDINFYIKYCSPNTSPQITTNPPGMPVTQPKTRYSICRNTPLCFDVMAKDSDFNWPTVSDTTELRIDSNILRYGATFLPNYTAATRSTNGPREDSYKFCWTPADSIPVEADYTFVISTADRRCPHPGIAQRTFMVRVSGYEPEITGDNNVYTNSTHIYSTPFHSASTWSWNIEGGTIVGLTTGNSVTVQWNTEGIGKIAVHEFGCNSLSDTMQVNITNNTGLKEAAALNQISVYPQPARNLLLIKGNVQLLTKGDLYTIDGKLIKTFSAIELQKGELSLSEIPQGNYFIHLQDSHHQTVVRQISVVK